MLPTVKTLCVNRHVIKQVVDFLATLFCAAFFLTTALAQEEEGQNPSVLGLNTTSGNVSIPQVSPFDGSLTKSYPFEVPAGRGAATPQLGLTYSSTRGNGNCGVGWGVGLPSIERMGPRKSIPEREFVVGNDYAFFFSGQELIRVTNTGAFNGAKYRTKQESFMELTLRIESDPTNSTGIVTRWEAIDASGTKFRFGSTQNARLRADFPAEEKHVMWLLDSVEDIFGNTVSYIYHEDVNFFNRDRDIPKTVMWGGNSQTGSPHQYKAEIILESRLDVIESNRRIVEGELWTKRISRIEVQHLVAGTWQMLWQYKLSYQQSSATGRSLLTSINKCTPTNQDYLPPVTLQYSDQVPTWDMTLDGQPANIKNRDGQPVYIAFVRSFNGQCQEVYETGVRMIDVTGDGLADFVVSDNIHIPAIYKNMGNGTWREEPDNFDPPTLFIRAENNKIWDYGVQFGDLDGDGLTDILRLYESQSGSLSREVFLNRRTYWEDATSSFTFPTYRDVPLSPNGAIPVLFSSSFSADRTYSRGVALMDVNGDGLADLISAPEGIPGYQAVFLNNGQRGWTEQPNSYDLPTSVFLNKYIRTAVRVDEGVRFGDINGDGLVDIVQGLVRSGSNGAFKNSVYLNTGRGWRLAGYSLPADVAFAASPTDEAIKTYDRGWRLIDINQDGLDDLIFSTLRYQYERKIFLNTGNGWREVDNSLWAVSAPFTIICGSTIQDAKDSGFRIADINGDGRLDYIGTSSFSTNSYDPLSFYTGSSAPQDILTSVISASGSKTDVLYRPSTAYTNTFLPSVFQTVSEIRTTDGVSNTPIGFNYTLNTYTTTYEYEGGLYDAVEREFRGFRTVKVFNKGTNNSNNGYTETIYLQDKSNAGKPSQVRVVSAAGTEISKTVMDYASDTSPPYFTPMTKTTVMQDGVSTETRFENFDSYNGQPKRVIQKNVPMPDGSTRDRIATTRFAYQEYPQLATEHRYGEVYESRSFDNAESDANLLAHKRTIYTNQFLGESGRQKFLPQQEQVLDKDRNAPTGEWITGSIITKRDAFGTPIETVDIDNEYSTTILGHNSRFPIASFSNARRDQVLADNFDDGSIADRDPVEWQAGGAWNVTSQGHLQHNTLSLDLLPLNVTFNSDVQNNQFIAEFDIRISNAVNGDYWAGFYFRKANNITSWDGGAYFYMRQNGNVGIWAASPAISVELNAVPSTATWQRVKLLVDGARVIVFINGRAVLTATGLTMTGYQLGFCTHGASAEFDNLRVYPADAYASSTSYDPNTLLVQHQTDVQGTRSRQEYDAFRVPVRTFNEEGLLSETEYRSGFARWTGGISPTNPNRTTTTSYFYGRADQTGQQSMVSRTFTDGLGREVQSQVADTLDEYGQQLWIVSAQSFDNLGRPFRNYRPYRAVTNGTYQSLATVQSQSPGWSETEYYADPLSRPNTKKPIGLTGGVSSNQNEWVSMTYSSETGQRVTTTASPFDNTGRTVSKAYTDAYGRATRSIANVGGGAEELTSTTEYDIQDRPVKTIDPKGLATTMRYTFLGQKRLVTTPDAGTSIMVYDRAGRLRFSQDAEGRANGNRINYFKYDTLGRLIEEGFTIGTDLTVDDNYRIATTNAEDRNFPAAPATWRKRMVYDSFGLEPYRKGRVVRTETNNDDHPDIDVIETYKYDKYGRTIEKSIQVLDYNSATYTTRYQYDDMGNVRKVIYPTSQ